MKITTSSITVSDIEIYARHGVLDQEKTVGNEFKVSVTLRFVARAAMMYDDVDNTVNYAQVVKIIHDVMDIPSNLIEHAAYRIVTALIEAFPTVTGGSVSVTKVHPPLAAVTAGATFTTDFTV